MAFDTLQEKLTSTFRSIQGKSKLSERNMEETLRDIRLALLEADVNYKVVKDLLFNIKEKSIGKDVYNSLEPGQVLTKIVYDEIKHLLGDSNQGINYQENDITTIMFVGLQGTGKTTSLAKVANLAKKKNNKNVLIIAADLQRPAAIEQLEILGKSIEIEVFTKGIEYGAINTIKEGLLYAKNNNFDTIFIDTAGRLQIDEILMDEIKTIKNSFTINETLLTLDALTGQDIINVASKFNEILDITGLVVTKFDGDSKGGGVLSVKSVTNVPIKFVGQGEKINDIDIFYPERLTERILGMGDIVSLVETVQDKFDAKQAEEDAKKLLSGKFTMDDMLKQLSQLEKMGSIKSIMGMIPGMGDLTKQIDDDTAKSQLKKTRAIIYSMTKDEREDPSYLRNSHKNRIANGSVYLFIA